MGTIGAVGQMAAPTTAQGLSTLGTAAAGGLGQGYVQDPFTANLVAQTRNQFFNSTVPQLDAPFIQAGQTGFSTPAMNTLHTAGATLETAWTPSVRSTVTRSGWACNPRVCRR